MLLLRNIPGKPEQLAVLILNGIDRVALPLIECDTRYFEQAFGQVELLRLV
ncbi:hypothetical protein D3C87_1730880 [compost metagenome]